MEECFKIFCAFLNRFKIAANENCQQAGSHAIMRRKAEEKFLISSINKSHSTNSLNCSTPSENPFNSSPLTNNNSSSTNLNIININNDEGNTDSLGSLSRLLLNDSNSPIKRSRHSLKAHSTSTNSSTALSTGRRTSVVVLEQDRERQFVGNASRRRSSHSMVRSADLLQSDNNKSSTLNLPSDLNCNEENVQNTVAKQQIRMHFLKVYLKIPKISLKKKWNWI